MPYKDPNKQKQSQQDYYAKNKAGYKDSQNKRRKRNRLFVLEQLRPCDRCGAFSPAFMDWHHRDPSDKIDNISRLVRHASIEKIQNEIDKCDCLCSNCHRLEHFDDNSIFYKND